MLLSKTGVIHVYCEGNFIEEVRFSFSEKYPD
ncbi:DUF5370 family protein [Virgibacillus sp. L01]